MQGFRVWGLRLFRGIILGLSRENGKELLLRVENLGLVRDKGRYHIGFISVLYSLIPYCTQ